MAYDLYDEQGFVGGGPSIGGLTDLKKALSSISPAVYPQMASLLTFGYATSPLRLKYESMALSKMCDEIPVKKTLLEIGKLATKAKTIVILHNHLS